jgi:2-dehydro-3-deoxyglucarate aldolase/4-hydroxy-2-oxoheptanedioate aldolase
MRQNRVKQMLAEGKTPLGTMIMEFNTTGVGRIAAEAGADFVMFDQEHTGWSVETIRMLVATTRSADVGAFVRVPATQYHLLARVLDVGAQGLMVPMVETEEQARLIVQSAKYPPQGRRGAGFGLAHDDYQDGDILEKMRTANEEGLLIAQIETAQGVENVDAIAAVDGIDVLWIGHFDLTNSLGIPGQFEHPDYLRSVDAVLAACARHGKSAGIMVHSVESGRALRAQGFRILAYWGDVWVYKKALREGLVGLREDA